MDHHEQHQLRHKQKRQEHKKEQLAYDERQTRNWLPFHPAWLAIAGLVLTLVALAVWTFLI
jgi:hypothetical protein